MEILDTFYSPRGRFAGAIIFEAARHEKVRIAALAGASAVVLSNPEAHMLDDPLLLRHVKSSLSQVPLILRVRVGHAAEAVVAGKLTQFVDENELLGIVDEQFIAKRSIPTPFISGCKTLVEGLKRVAEGASILCVQDSSAHVGVTVKLVKSLFRDIETLASMNSAQALSYALVTGAPPEILLETKKHKKLPIPIFAAGGIATSADAVLMIELGCDGVFMRSGARAGGEREAKNRAEVIIALVERAWKAPRQLSQVH